MTVLWTVVVTREVEVPVPRVYVTVTSRVDVLVSTLVSVWTGAGVYSELPGIGPATIEEDKGETGLDEDGETTDEATDDETADDETVESKAVDGDD